ncbi:MAG: alpha/beta fold hydrolase [Oscillospiraceae bacterium]
MKKTNIVLLCILLLLLTLVGCSSDESVIFEEDMLIQNSTSLSEKMAKGEFEEVVVQFSEKMKKSLTVTGLKASYNGVVADIGEFVEFNSATFSKKGKIATVDAILEYKENGIKVSFSYNTENEIVGLWINYATIKKDLVHNATYKEIAILIGNGENKLDGILCLPKIDKAVDVAILVQGSGQSDLNETIGTASNVPFKDIAIGLAEKGIASIRYNKRYYQYPKTATEEMTIYDEVLNDVKDAINFAGNNEHSKFERITIIGHSLGGMLAPKIAQDNPAVDKIISLAGSPRKLEDIILEQNKDVLKGMTDKTQTQKDKLLNQVQQEVGRVKNLKKGEKGKAILGVPSFYWYSLNQIDSKEIAQNLEIPMLFLQGKADFQVKVKLDFAEWQEALKGKSNVTFKGYPNLNHLFMKTNGKTDVSEYNIKGEVDKTVINDMCTWIVE